MAAQYERSAALEAGQRDSIQTATDSAYEVAEIDADKLGVIQKEYASNAKSSIESSKEQSKQHVVAEDAEEMLHFFGKIRYRLRKPLAEFLGTLILVLFGDGVVAQTVLSSGTKGAQITIAIGWGLAVLFGIYTCFGVSGGHINPAVTITLAAFGRMRWVDVPSYIVAQLLGGFAGAGLVYANYLEAFNAFDGGVRTITGPTATAGVFCTYPQPFMTWTGSFFDQVLETALLMGIVFVATDERNCGNTVLVPALVGLGVTCIGLCFGWQTGFAINPARDLGPRMMSAAVGYRGVFTFGDYYCLVPIFGPIIGALIGGCVYTILIDSGAKENSFWGRRISLRERRASLLGAAS